MKARKSHVGMYIYTLRSVNDVTEGITQESPMGDSWVIPRKVDKMVWISVSDSYYKAGRAGHYWLEEENDGWFLGDSYYYLGRGGLLLIGK